MDSRDALARLGYTDNGLACSLQTLCIGVHIGIVYVMFVVVL